MVNAKHLILIGAVSLFGTAHAQVNGVVEGLVGPQGLAGNALGTLGGATTQVLGTVGSALPGGLGAAVPALTNALGTTLSNGLGGDNGLDLANITSDLPGLTELTSTPLGQSLAGDLPASLLVASDQIDPNVLQALLTNGVSALPAGVLSVDTMVPVSSLDGLDPALEALVRGGSIAATLLPADLPVSTSALDPLVLTALLQEGMVPVALLPSLTALPVGALAGL